MSRLWRRSVAQETVAILERGDYHTANGERRIGDAVAAAVEGTRLYRSGDLAPTHDTSSAELPSVDVVNQTTFAGARDLLGDGAPSVCCLNFASARNPGGGFLSGSQAQEESLARASALSACLHSAWDYYAENRANRSTLYLDHVIYSPDVPVFRDDRDELLDEPWLCSIVTAPAPNAGAVTKNQPDRVDDVLPVLKGRAWRVLEICRLNAHRHVVLGAWGCGVFRNDPADVAGVFQELLATERFAGAFDRVRFSVLDLKDDGTFEAFQSVFAPSSS